MGILDLTTNQKESWYLYLRKRRLALQDRAYKALGNICSLCGSSDGLRIRFNDFNNPLRDRYKTNPNVLHRRLTFDPQLRNAVSLFCANCRIKRGLNRGRS